MHPAKINKLFKRRDTPKINLNKLHTAELCIGVNSHSEVKVA